MRVKFGLVREQGVCQAGGELGSLGGYHLVRVEAERQLVHDPGGDALELVVKLDSTRQLLLLLLEIHKLIMQP